MAAIIEMDPLTNPLDNECITDDMLENYLKTDDKDGFIGAYARRYGEYFRSDSVAHLSSFLNKLNDECFSRAVRNLKEKQIFAIHDLFLYSQCLDDVKFLQGRMHLLGNYSRNSHQRTWLHCAVRKVVSGEFVQFVVEDLNVSPHIQDNMGNTALHEFCVHVTKDDEHVKQIISLLMGVNGCLLTMENSKKTTPLEVACRRKFVFDAIKVLVNFDDSLGHVDVLGDGFASIEITKVSIQDNASFWRHIFTENDKSKLLSFMKDGEGFANKYLMDEEKFEHAFRTCASDGALKNEITQCTEEILNKRAKVSDIFGLSGAGNCTFYRSAPFLALITGQWNLVMPLVVFSRFDVMPFCLFTCAVCVKMKQWRNITETVRQKIDEIHQSADAYLTEITNVMHQKHTQNADYDIVYDYLTKPTNLSKGCLTDAGYSANCRKWFNSFACQTVFNRLWKETRGNCFSSFQKYVFHSIIYIVFLLCLYSVLLTNSASQIGGLEIFCYLYGIGYFVEEVRQMLCYYRMNQFTHYFLDATNIVDLIGLASLLTAFSLRYSFSFYHGAADRWEWQIKQSFCINFYAYLFLCLTAILLSIRLLYFLSVFKAFGPKLKMIESMIVINLLPVSVIFIVFILSFGVAFQSLIFSSLSNEIISIERNSSSTVERIITRLADILWQPTFTIFEPKYVIEQATESKSPSIENPMMKLVVQFLLIMFIIIVSVMLMNMLIALLSQTVSDIRLTSKESWAIDRWKFIREYNEKSFLVPPLNIVEIVGVAIKSIFKRHAFNGNEDKQCLNVHPFAVLFLLKENRFSLMKNIETSSLETKNLEVMDQLRNKVEQLEETLNIKTSNLGVAISSLSQELRRTETYH